MKKKTKNLLVLAVVLVLLVAGYFAVGMVQNKEQPEEIPETDIIPVADFAVADIVAYEYTNPQYSIGFDITEKGYVHQEDESFPVSEASVEIQLGTLAALYADRKIESSDKAEYGLDAPQVTISVTLKDGRIRNFLIGDKALFEDAYYLSDEENGAIYLVTADQCGEFNNNWTAMVEKEPMVTVTTDQIVDVTVQTAGEVTTVVSYNEALEYPWQITTKEGTFAGNTEAVLEKLTVFGNYSARSTVEYYCQDVTAYGLDGTGTVVTVRYRVSEGVVLPEGVSADEIFTLTFEFGAADADGVYYTRVDNSEYVYGFSSYYMAELSEFLLEELKMTVETETAE